MGILEDFYKVDNELAQLIHDAFCESQDVEGLHPETHALILQRAANKEEFATKLGSWYLHLSSKLEGRKAEYKPVQERILEDLKAIERELDFVLWLINSVLPPGEGSEIINDQISLTYRRSEKVEIKNPEFLPVDYCRFVQEPDKKAIKTAFQKGKEVPGAALVEAWNLQVKQGGDAAVRRQAVRLKKKARGDKENEGDGC